MPRGAKRNARSGHYQCSRGQTQRPEGPLSMLEGPISRAQWEILMHEVDIKELEDYYTSAVTCFLDVILPKKSIKTLSDTKNFNRWPKLGVLPLFGQKRKNIFLY